MPPAALAMMTGLPGRAIEDDAQVELAGHLQPLFDQHARHDPPFGAGLVRDEGHADHRRARACSASSGLLASLTPPPLPRPPAWICALTTTTRAAQAPGDLAGFSRRGCDLAARHGHAVARENGFGLILVDFHDVRKLLMLTCASFMTQQ